MITEAQLGVQMMGMARAEGHRPKYPRYLPHKRSPITTEKINWSCRVRELLSDGYGVEDIAVKLGCKADAVRKEVQTLRDMKVLDMAISISRLRMTSKGGGK